MDGSVSLTSPGPVAARHRRLLRPALYLAGPLVVAVIAVGVYLAGGRYVTTENAYVGAESVAVTAESAGRIADVAVREGDHVAAGDLLFRIDPEPYRIAVEKAQAQLDAAALAVAVTRQEYAETLAQVEAARADAALAAKQETRVATLAARQFASRADRDKATAGLSAARARLAALDQAAQAKLAALAGDPKVPVERTPRYMEAKAALDEARRQLAQTTVRATIAGMVTQTATLVPGHYVTVGAPVAMVVSTDKLWVDANLVETDMTHVVAGEPATVTIDSYPGVTFDARVVAVAPGTGAEFAVIPAQNASGNWVKVVQRVTVRLALVTPAGGPALRAGLSAQVAIDTGGGRVLSGLF